MNTTSKKHCSTPAPIRAAFFGIAMGFAMAGSVDNLAVGIGFGAAIFVIFTLAWRKKE